MNVRRERDGEPGHGRTVIRPQLATDDEAVRALLALAFPEAANVLALEEALSRRPDSHGFVGEIDGRVVGHVRLTRSWIDAESRLVEVLVLSPLSVAPAYRRRGLGAALCAHAVYEADGLGAPAVFLEGSPSYYARLGWRAGSELGVTPPSVRIPNAAFRAIALERWEDWMRGALVYAEPFWACDCVGLRGEALDRIRGPRRG